MFDSKLFSNVNRPLLYTRRRRYIDSLSTRFVWFVQVVTKPANGMSTYFACAFLSSGVTKWLPTVLVAVTCNTGFLIPSIPKFGEVCSAPARRTSEAFPWATSSTKLSPEIPSIPIRRDKTALLIQMLCINRVRDYEFCRRQFLANFSAGVRDRYRRTASSC